MRGVWPKIAIIGSTIVLTSQPTIAEIRPDRTLGDRRSRVVPNVEVRGKKGDRIRGGVRRGQNLFHSFREFSVERGQRVYFDNPNGVENIFARVTGRSPSTIRGRLGVDGSANLFLLNPNGILLGRGAQLDVRGTFVATTADSLQFGNQTFSASDPQPPSSLLTVDPSAFLFNQLPAAITSQDAALKNSSPSRGLLLLGGPVRLQQTMIETLGGTVAIGGVGGPGRVELQQQNGDWQFTFPDRLDRADVTLDGTTLNPLGIDQAGAITVTAQSIQIQNSHLQIDLSNLFSSEQPVARAIRLDATDRLHISQSQINTISGEQNAGDITIRAGGTIELRDSEIRSESQLSGNSGNVRVTSGASILTQQSQILSQATGGKAGQVNVIAADRIQIRGQDAGIGATEANLVGSTGRGGIATIRARFVYLDNAFVTAATLGSEGGSIRLNAQDLLLLRNHSRITTLTGPVGSGGNAGNIDIDAGFIAAIPTESSYISAGSSRQAGGTVQVNTQRVFGIRAFNREEARARSGIDPAQTLDPFAIPTRLPSSITALAQTAPSLDGQIQINQLEIDPARRLGMLPSTIVDASQLIAQPCQPSQPATQPLSEFVITGRGGLPPSPTDLQANPAVQTNWATLEATTEPLGREPSQPTAARRDAGADLPVEAQGWRMGDRGEVLLVAQGPAVIGRSAFETFGECAAVFHSR